MKKLFKAYIIFPLQPFFLAFLIFGITCLCIGLIDKSNESKAGVLIGILSVMFGILPIIILIRSLSCRKMTKN